LRRTHHDVEAAILKSCVFNSLSISQLLASQNLSYKVLKPTLNHLVLCKLVEYEIDGRRKLVTTTGQGLIALEAYENALALLEGHQALLLSDVQVQSTSARRRRSWKNVIEQKDRTTLPRPIILEQ
jgi:predicted transcriptional regulator